MARHKERSGTSQSVEDFLKKVYTLQQSVERVSTNALADALNITAPSVTDYRKYKGIRLTDNGEQVALKILRRHRLIELYLVQGLGYELHEVHDEAEALEHTVSDRFIAAIATKLDHPEFDPHGDPIPDVEGIMPTRDLLPLSVLPLDTPARICRFVMENPDMLQHSQERGLIMGAELEMLSRDPFDGPIRLKMHDDSLLVIGHAVASAILVEILESA